ncbi:putative transcription initiation factor TFIIIB [Ordospora pajunii]|jgi:transcription factor IIIB subunit 2|uniref:putative transcription initiation factor TFIIIB n=1 Tax=Ordospora pajunii TaxID=3039483 RepID=UPI0029527ACC|nr:putative transcription initiation factor TFIIIB [Ordospora pajunii]KAH9412306.1 putative transcription initiation factor TFIIIB [Ordospora pajunii]
MGKCQNCSSEEFTTDTMHGAVYCMVCGMVQEESGIVAALNFNTEGCKATLNGQIIDIQSRNVGTGFVDPSYYIKNTISGICASLGLGGDHIECSFRWYKLLLQHNLSKGKSILYTLSACIYIVCRQEGTPHMLMDFSNALRIDVFKIGKSFLRITSMLNIDIPLIDPSLYMPRFVSRLRFESKEVLSLSLRLISRMKRDWIVVGRRPNNLCGAALLVASRIVGEERSIYEIARTVHVSVSTINRRLKEIGDTESANLSIEEFNATWLEKEEDPPAVKMMRVMMEKVKELESRSSESIPYSTPQSSIDSEGSYDEDEIDRNILSPEESRKREIVWEEMYGEFMSEREKRMKSGVKKHRKKRRVEEYDSIIDAFRSLEKRMSGKLNYQAIESIFDNL